MSGLTRSLVKVASSLPSQVVICQRIFSLKSFGRVGIELGYFPLYLSVLGSKTRLVTGDLARSLGIKELLHASHLVGGLRSR